MNLDGQRVLITGGSSGLGQRLVVVFCELGARVAFNYASNEAGAAETERAARAFSGDVRAFKQSVLDVAGLRASIGTLEAEWGGIDVLVNNAGISQALPVALLEEEDWDRVFDVNVKGAYLTTRAVLKGMIRRRGGRILNIGSLAGVRLIEAPVHYAASKAAIKGLTESLAKEVGRYGITVNSLAPGLLEGGVAAGLPDYRLHAYLQHCPLGRLGTFDEVARLAAFMVSDANRYMTGFTLVADGGL
jgi:NAD(P)-dependent dehydrogenase (short-subunit alcohol dehydrogenase family)